MTQPFDPEPTGPVVSDDPSKRWVGIAIVVVLGAALVFAAVQLAGGGDDDVAADDVGAAVGGPGTTAGEGTSEGEDTPAETETPPTTAPAAPPDLFADASKPFSVFAEIYDTPINVYEIVIYPDWSYIVVQVPDEPTYVDEYTWRGGDGVSGPEEGDVFNEDELPEKFFDLTEIDPAKIPSMVEQAIAQFPAEGTMATHIIIDRFLPFDTRVIVRVYVDEGGRGDGGYVQFTPDGGFVETVS